MSFGRPLLLLALLAIPVAVALWLLAERRRARYAVAFTNLAVLASVAGGRSWRRHAPPLLFLLALATLCVAVARPRVDTMIPNDQATVVLVVDVSRSMEAKDVKPTRLGAAQAAVRTFLDRVPKRVRVGLIIFSGDAQLATPPTADHDLVREAVDDIDYFQGYGGTAIGDALALAVDVGNRAVGNPASAGPEVIGYTPGSSTRSFAPMRLAAAAAPQRLVSILFLSDGKQTRGLLTPQEGADRAKAARIPVYTVALGTPNGTLDAFGFGGPGGAGGGAGGFFQGGSGGPPGVDEFGRIRVPPDPKTLGAIARTTGGEFFAARSAESLSKAYAKLGSSLGRTPGKREVTNLFLLAAAAALVAAGVLSALWSPRLP